MDQQKKPRAREKRVVEGSASVEKKGEGLGTGPVNNTGNYESRREQQAQQAQQRPVSSAQGTPRPVQRPASSAPQRPASASQGTQRPVQRPGSFTQQGQQTQRPGSFSQRPASTSAQRPASSAQRPTAAAQRPASSAQRPASTVQRPAAQQARQSSTVQRGSGSGCGGKLILIVVALVVLLGGGKLTGLFDGGSNTALPVSTSQTVQTGNSGTSSGQDSGMDLSNLLSSLLGSGSGSVYDSGSVFSALTGGSGSTQSGSSLGSLFSGMMSGSSGQTSSSSQNASSVLAGASSGSKPDESVASGARAKRTEILGGKKDKMTILVYMCGTDLESQNGMGTADLKEMAKADLGDNVSLVIYTGGCKRWRNDVVSSTANQIYEIRNGGLYCLEKNMGTASMTSPDTLETFIKYGKKYYSANRMALIFWDHGGGSVTGYGYDERYGSGSSMTLAGINTALKNAGVTFDFIGFDACLMATVENALMLSQYADYLIASEETEPGVGWYYTNWLTKLGENPSMKTTEIGKLIADDFVAVCDRQCRGQATTLSVVDLAELETTVPKELKDFSVQTNDLIQNNQYKTVSSARGKTREFAQSSKIDQVDLVHFAKNLGTSEGKELAEALQGAIKYNRTGGGMSNAYGLSIYFPYKRTGKVNQMVSTYQAIGMDEEYTRCIQEFASLEISGQAAGGSMSGYYGSTNSGMPSLLGSLLGNGSYTGGVASSQDSMTDLLEGLFGGGSDSLGSLSGLFSGRSMTADKAAAYIADNHFDANTLVWKNGRITLDSAQWSQVESLMRNVFIDDGEGYVDLGTDNDFVLEGNDLVSGYDGTWLSIDRHLVAYYYLGTVENGDEYLISGYVPALLNGQRVNLILNFDHERPYGYIAGAETVYSGSDPGVQAKTLIAIGEGDTIQPICDYFDYEGSYLDSYRLGDSFTLGAEPEIANIAVKADRSLVTYCFTDYYQQPYWTPPEPEK